MLRFLEIFRQTFQNPGENMWQTSYNLASIETPDYGYNKIPDSCSIKIDIRYIPEDAAGIQKKLTDILPSDFCLEIYAFEPPFFTEKNHPDIQRLCKCVEKQNGMIPRIYGANGTSDARHFGTHGIEF